MRIVFIGTGEIGVPTLRALLNSEHEVVAVVTQPDKPVGREQRIESPPIKKALMGRARPPASAKATAGEPGAPAAVGEADSFPTGTSIAIWTTTPWTLPANLAIAVDPKAN